MPIGRPRQHDNSIENAQPVCRNILDLDLDGRHLRQVMGPVGEHQVLNMSDSNRLPVSELNDGLAVAGMERGDIRRRAAAKVDAVVAATAIDRIVADVAVDVEYIVSTAALKGVAPGAGIHGVAAITPDQKLMVAIAGMQNVFAVSAHQRVECAIAAPQGVVAVTADQQLMIA
jgi:hypothetical protein